MFSSGCARDALEFSRLPDSATLAPLRMVERISRQGRLEADVSPLRLAVEAAYLGECDFSIGFLLTRRPSTMSDPTGLKGCPVNPGVGESVMGFPSIELIATAGWPAPIQMENRAVHVWGFSLDGNLSFVEQCRSWLSADERGRAARLIRQQDHVRYVLAHGGLRAVLSRYLGIGPDDVALSRSEAGKPFVTEKLGDQSAITFNMSHAHGRALIAVSKGQEVGVDLERIRSNIEVAKLSERYFAPSEHTMIMQSPQTQRAARFFRYWVAKEAVIKAQGIGLRALSQCEILLGADGAHPEVLASVGSPIEPNWGVRLLSCDEGWEAAVAARGINWAVQYGLAGS